MFSVAWFMNLIIRRMKRSWCSTISSDTRNGRWVEIVSLSCPIIMVLLAWWSAIDEFMVSHKARCHPGEVREYCSECCCYQSNPAVIRKIQGQDKHSCLRSGRKWTLKQGWWRCFFLIRPPGIQMGMQSRRKSLLLEAVWNRTNHYRGKRGSVLYPRIEVLRKLEKEISKNNLCELLVTQSLLRQVGEKLKKIN